jgi:WD40 repeat protein
VGNQNRAAIGHLQCHTSGVWGVALTADAQLVACGSFDGTVRLWEANTGTSLRILRPERRYEHLDITGLTGITAAQRAALLASGAIEQHAPVASRPPGCRWSRCGKTRTRFGRVRSHA